MEHMEATLAGEEELEHPHTLTHIHLALTPQPLTLPALALSTFRSQGSTRDLPLPTLAALLLAPVLGLGPEVALALEVGLALALEVAISLALEVAEVGLGLPALAVLEEGWVEALHHQLQSLPSCTGSQQGTSG